eukprot:CAMPEP_0172560350 /NCGR_PEP_ID=MMETSP1067-20121228/88334_1 /TAXON_ID=265564 ORGANISM="Thalassiosira punctigera, Strain Tpunct2005C2" /NCGR_SAMPLE_ID=MMETSP1067 /ASSEMBLY_ACC=CAM_ASM_000444 /LENGTH=48 /DNA_ID= /DNA_START= /DNA_END= /DNA_ORIENTATION=
MPPSLKSSKSPSNMPSVLSTTSKPSKSRTLKPSKPPSIELSASPSTSE